MGQLVVSQALAVVWPLGCADAHPGCSGIESAILKSVKKWIPVLGGGWCGRCFGDLFALPQAITDRRHFP